MQTLKDAIVHAKLLDEADRTSHVRLLEHDKMILRLYRAVPQMMWSLLLLGK